MRGRRRSNGGAGTGLALILGLLAALALALPGGPAAAQPSRPVSVDLGRDGYAGEFMIPRDKSQILRVDQPFADLLIGNPDIADVLPLTDRTIYVLGKQLGATSLSIYGLDDQLIAVLDLVVTHDIDGLKRRLYEIVPGERVEVRTVNDSLVLSGMISSTDRVGRVVSLAERYSESVTNLMRVRGSQQVMLAVRFAEVKRSAAKNLGLTNRISYVSDDFTAVAGTGNALLGGIIAPSPLNFGFAALGAEIGNWTIDMLLEALEEQELLKTLAEPNLVALSGETANFLAGGEFPIPVSRDTDDEGTATTVTIEFKEFGVSLAFTPTVLDDGLINLVVAPEVSAIDPTVSVVTAGIQVPGLLTRRARTTVDLRDGQSFAIAGLLQSDFRDSIARMPIMGDLPILGPLFRSSGFQQDETELVIIVTPYLAAPARPEDLLLPTDDIVPPSDFELFVQGLGESAAGVRLAPGVAGAQRGLGGLDGRIGHVIE